MCVSKTREKERLGKSREAIIVTSSGIWYCTAKERKKEKKKQETHQRQPDFLW